MSKRIVRFSDEYFRLVAKELYVATPSHDETTEPVTVPERVKESIRQMAEALRETDLGRREMLLDEIQRGMDEERTQRHNNTKIHK